MENKSEILGASVVVLLAAGVLYLSGHLMASAYYGYFGIPLSMLEINSDVYQILLFGRWPFACILLIFCGALFINGGLIKFKSWLTGKRPELANCVPAITTSGSVVIYSGLAIIIVFTYAIILSNYITNQESYVAERVRNNNFPRIYFSEGKVLLKDKPLYLLGYGGAKYFAFTTTKNSSQRPSVYIISDNDVGQVQIQAPSSK